MNLIRKINIYIRRAYFMGHYPSIIKVIFSKKKKLVYYGFLGDGNFGDELVYQATKELFSDCIVIPYLRHMPVFTRIYCKKFSNQLSGVIIGGGTLVRNFSCEKTKPFFERMITLNKPIFFHGTGVGRIIKQEHFWISLLTSNKRYGGVRGPLALKFLQNKVKDINFIGDAALFLKGKKEHIIREKLIIINFGTHNLNDDLEVGRNIIVKFLNDFIKRDYRIVFLPFHKIDLEIGKQLKNKIKQLEVFDVVTSFQSCFNLIASAQFCIGERLHFVVMCILANTKFLSLNYDDKHIDFLKSLNLEDYGVSPKFLSSNYLKNYFSKNRNTNWNDVNSIVDLYRQKQLKEKDSFL